MTEKEIKEYTDRKIKEIKQKDQGNQKGNRM